MANQQGPVDSASVKSLIMNNMRYFECILMCMIMRDINFWKDFCRNKLNVKVNPLQKNSLKFNDFSNSLDNTIYKIINASWMFRAYP